MNNYDLTTLKYYNENAKRFYWETVNVSFSAIQEAFIKYLPKGAYILDFGCGSGRDSKAFMDKGYKVDAIDGSEEMCKLAEKLIGKEVKCIRFQDFKETNKYDGIWACSSILHLDINSLYNVFDIMKKALKDSGYLYTSFKYGNFRGIRNGRYFTDMTEDSFNEFILSVGGFDIIDINITKDVRPGREEEKWINIILKKQKK